MTPEEEEEERKQKAFEDKAGCFIWEAIGCAVPAVFLPVLIAGIWWM